MSFLNQGSNNTVSFFFGFLFLKKNSKAKHNRDPLNLAYLHTASVYDVCRVLAGFDPEKRTHYIPRDIDVDNMEDLIHAAFPWMREVRRTFDERAEDTGMARSFICQLPGKYQTRLSLP